MTASAGTPTPTIAAATLPDSTAACVASVIAFSGMIGKIARLPRTRNTSQASLPVAPCRVFTSLASSVTVRVAS